MQNNQDKLQESKEKVLENKLKPLLTRKEVQTIVKDFAVAYISGQIKVSLPDCAHIMTMAKEKNEPVDKATAISHEINGKRHFSNCISIVLGAKQATPAEFEQAVTQLFDRILSLRNGDRISGQFMESNLSFRVRQLEEGMDKANKLLDDLVDYIMKGN